MKPPIRVAYDGSARARSDLELAASFAAEEVRELRIEPRLPRRLAWLLALSHGVGGSAPATRQELVDGFREEAMARARSLLG